MATKTELREALQWALEYIDAIPADAVLPAMPGFDRDYVDGLIQAAKAEEEAENAAPVTITPAIAASATGFNGFHVEFWSIKSRRIEEDHFTTVDAVLKRGFDVIPTIEELADGLYEVYGDTVGLIKDNDGKVLLDKREAMIATAKEVL